MRMSTVSNKSNDIAAPPSPSGAKDQEQESGKEVAAAATSWDIHIDSAMSFGYSNIPVAISIHILTELNWKLKLLPELEGVVLRLPLSL